MLIGTSTLIRIGCAALAAFIASSIYYGVFFAAAWQELAGFSEPPTVAAWQIAAQFGRNAVVATVLALVLSRIGGGRLTSNLAFAGLLWLGFNAMAIAGSVIHEAYPLALYAIHAGDALMTLLVMATVLTPWHSSERVTEAA